MEEGILTGEFFTYSLREFSRRAHQQNQHKTTERNTMSDFVVIHKQDLKALAQDTPDKDGLLRVLETKFDPDPKNKYKFLVMPSNTAEHPPAYAVDESLDWKLIHTVADFVGQLCAHLPREEQERISQRLLEKLSLKFHCTVHTLGETLGAFVPKARKLIEDEAVDAKQSVGFAPESVEALIKSLWRQCEEATEKVADEDENEKNSRP